MIIFDLSYQDFVFGLIDFEVQTTERSQTIFWGQTTRFFRRQTTWGSNNQLPSVFGFLVVSVQPQMNSGLSKIVDST